MILYFSSYSYSGGGPEEHVQCDVSVMGSFWDMTKVKRERDRIERLAGQRESDDFTPLGSGRSLRGNPLMGWFSRRLL